LRTLLENDIGLYRELIDHANIIVSAFDVAGNVLVWNKAAEIVTGYTKSQVVADKRILKRLYPDPHHCAEFLRRLNGPPVENVGHVEFTLVARHGVKKHISWSIFPVTDRSGMHVGSFALGIDVTLKHLIKQKERESFRALLKSVRLHEEDRKRYEAMVEALKEEVNALCRELSRPPHY